MQPERVWSSKLAERWLGPAPPAHCIVWPTRVVQTTVACHVHATLTRCRGRVCATPSAHDAALEERHEVATAVAGTARSGPGWRLSYRREKTGDDVGGWHGRKTPMRTWPDALSCARHVRHGSASGCASGGARTTRLAHDERARWPCAGRPPRCRRRWRVCARALPPRAPGRPRPRRKLARPAQTPRGRR